MTSSATLESSVDLSTRYLGLQLPHPFMPGASPMVDDLGTVRRLEDAGAAAIVMNSLFEEQLEMEQGRTLYDIESNVDAFSEARSFFPRPADFRLGPDAYGMTVRREIEARLGRHLSIGAVYATLERLEEKGLVTSLLNDPTPERGGRAKRTFKLTGTGADAVNRARQDLANMQEGLAFPQPRGAR